MKHIKTYKLFESVNDIDDLDEVIDELNEILDDMIDGCTNDDNFNISRFEVKKRGFLMDKQFSASILLNRDISWDGERNFLYFSELVDGFNRLIEYSKSNNLDISIRVFGNLNKDNSISDMDIEDVKRRYFGRTKIIADTLPDVFNIDVEKEKDLSKYSKSKVNSVIIHIK